jgi:hypothetical protein
MTHTELTSKASKWLNKHDENIIVPNCPTITTELKTATTFGEIPDIIGWCSHASVLIEVKVSRSDFLKDRKKKFRKFPELGVGELRYYCCEPGIINIDDLPKKWGLLIYFDNKILIVKKAEIQEANINSERTILLSILRREK